MSKLSVNIYCSYSQLPEGLCEKNIFHSPHYFQLAAQTPRFKPYMLTVENEEQQIMAQMLAVIRYRLSWFPPYLYRHCLILGEGVYPGATEETPTPVLFGMMLQKLTEKLGRTTLYLEVSHLSSKMFAYKQFKENHFFPVRWISIHNSLHSLTPEERISQRMRHRIESAYRRGVITDEVKDEADFQSFMRLLRHHNWLKPKRYIPDDAFFRGLLTNQYAHLFVTRYHHHIIGCSCVVYCQKQAYLWYAAYRRKSFARLHPDLLTIWHTLQDAHQRGYEHMHFMDVGLPFQKNSFREFILRFGGKPSSGYRWFHCSIGWINRILSWFYRD